jgi:hypothetical protein
MPILLKLLQIIQLEEITPNTVNKARITLILQPEKDATIKTTDKYL